MDGDPVIGDKADLPEKVRSLVGGAFFAITSSISNESCPCDADNGQGMDAVVHFLMVDLMRRTSLPPGVYHVFQTDWVAAEDCRATDFRIEITDGPGEGLRGIGQPLRNMIIGTIPGQAVEFGRGLTTTSERVSVRCGGGQRSFIRGDANADGEVNLSDAVTVLGYLFLSGGIECEVAGDTDDSGKVNVSDVIFMLDALFRGGEPVVPPYPSCGPLPSGGPLGCRRTGCE